MAPRRFITLNGLQASTSTRRPETTNPTATQILAATPAQFVDCLAEFEPLPNEINEIRKVCSKGSKEKIRARGDFVGPPEGMCYMVEWDRYGCPIGECGKQLNRHLACFAKQGELWPIDKKWVYIDYLAFEDT